MDARQDQERLQARHCLAVRDAVDLDEIENGWGIQDALDFSRGLQIFFSRYPVIIK